MVAAEFPMARRISTPSREAQEAVHRFRYEQRGNLRAIGQRLGITKQAISGWQAVPAEWVRTLSEFTGTPAWRLRPDLYEAPLPETSDAAG